MILHGLRTLLLAQSGITALVPAQTVNRNTINCIFCESPMQGVAPPFVVLKQVGGDPYLTLGTYSEMLKTAEIQIKSYSYSEVDAEMLDKTIRQFLDDQLGVAAGVSDTLQAVCDWSQPENGYDFPAEGFDSKYHFTMTRYTVQFSTP